MSTIHTPSAVRRLLVLGAAWAVLAGSALPLQAQTPADAALAPVQASEPQSEPQSEPLSDPAAQRPAPRYLLQGPGGRAVTSEDFRGRLQLVAFGFVSCPDVCPTTLLEMQQLLAALGPRAARVQPLFVTVDPRRDTRAVLDEYTRAFDARILGLTGSPELVARAARAFGVTYREVREPGAPPEVYTMDHSAGITVLGPDGAWLGRLAWGTPVAELARRVRAWLDMAGGVRRP